MKRPTKVFIPKERNVLVESKEWITLTLIASMIDEKLKPLFIGKSQKCALSSICALFLNTQNSERII